MEEFLKSIGIDKQGTYTDDGCYSIDLTDDEWSKYYNKLNKSKELEVDEDISNIAEDSSTIVFYSDIYDITLIENDEEYKLVIKED